MDEYQQTSVPGIFCAGEPTGIGGLELALVEGEIAGYAATNWEDRAKHLFAKRARYQKVVRILQDAFPLRPELKISRARTRWSAVAKTSRTNACANTLLARRQIARPLRHGPLPRARLRARR